MALKLITAPTTEPITIEEAKAQCRVDDASEDTLIGLYIKAARAKAENYTGTAIITQVWEQSLDAFPEAEIELLRPPVTAIDFVTYRDLDSATQTLANTRYTLDANTFPGWLLPAIDQGWPGTDGSANCVTLRYTTGYANAAAIPADMRAWLLLTINFLFENRTAFTEVRLNEIPNRAVDTLIDPYRVFKV